MNNQGGIFMMDGVVHRFFLSSEFDISQKIEKKISYKTFLETHEKLEIEDNFIQILLANKYLIDVPSYDYENKILSSGLDPLSGTVFRNNQVHLLLNKLNIFESEIDNEKNNSEMQNFECTKDEVIKELNKLRSFLRKGIVNNMCIYHVGL